MLKKITSIVLTTLFAMQFIRPAKNIAGNETMMNDISTIYPVPENVQHILKVSCYDCHSNNTWYPWYGNFQPVGWWMQFHVNEGKLELNFNEFASYDSEKQQKKLKKIVEEVKENYMPLPSYVKMHREAKLTQNEKNILMDWVASVQNLIGKRNND